MSPLHTFRDHLLRWYGKSARDLPWRKTSDPYLIWLSEIMCQQTGVSTVVPYFERFKNRYPRVQDLAEADESEVLRLWEGLGYYSRARNLKKAAEIIVQKFDSCFPSQYEFIRSLPGIGEYTAGAILSIAFRKSTAALDGNLIRVYSRYYSIEDSVDQLETRKNLWKIAKEHAAVAHKCSREFAEAMMELGALVCRPKNPSCSICPLKMGCMAYKNGKVLDLPKKSKKQERVKLAELIFWSKRSTQILVLEKGSDPKYPHFHRLPFQSFDIKKTPKKYLLKEKYSVTHRDFSVYVMNKKPELKNSKSIWMTQEEIESSSFPAIDRRIIDQLLDSTA